MLLMIWGIIVIVVGILGGLWLLLGNLWPGYNQGFNLVGLGPVGLALCNGLPPLVAGATLRLLTDVEQQSRAAIASADQSRKASEAAVKNSEMLIKSTETMMRNTEVAVKNTENTLKTAATAALAAPAAAVTGVVDAAQTGAASAADAAQAAANTVADAAADTASRIGSALPKLGS
jgi:hypothetical protein